MPNRAYDKLIVPIATENTQEHVFKTTSPVHSSLYPRSIKFYVNTELSNPCPAVVVQKRICPDGKSSVSAHSQGFSPLPKTQ